MEKVEKLEFVLKMMKEKEEYQSKVNDLVGDIINENPIIEAANTYFDMLIDDMITPEGIDIINEFMFGFSMPSFDNYSEDNPLVLTDENHTKIENISDLVTYIVKNNLFDE